MSIEAIAALTSPGFASKMVDVLHAAKDMTSGGDSYVTCCRAIASDIERFRRQAIQQGRTAYWFPALNMVEDLFEREGFAVARFRKEAAQ